MHMAGSPGRVRETSQKRANVIARLRTPVLLLRSSHGMVEAGLDDWNILVIVFHVIQAAHVSSRNLLLDSSGSSCLHDGCQGEEFA